MVWSGGSAKRQTNQRSRRAIQVGVLETLGMQIMQIQRKRDIFLEKEENYVICDRLNYLFSKKKNYFFFKLTRTRGATSEVQKSTF